MKKINITITGALGRMGKILIKRISKNKNIKLFSLTDLKCGKIINGIKVQKNNLEAFKKTDVDESDSKKRLGVIAQDLVGKYDEAVNASKRSDDDETEYLSVQYTDLVPVLIKALQEARFLLQPNL